MPGRARRARYGRGAAAIAFASVLLAATAAPAVAACPLENAVYAGRGGIMTIAFRPTAGSMTVTNSFRLTAGEATLDGIVMWTAEVSRSWGVLMDDCPEGDLTGAEIAACTVWEGVVYAVDEAGEVGLLPREGEPAPQALILADLGAFLAQWDRWGEAGSLAEPWDAFEITGCLQ